jgi:hypothetical protein
VGADEIDAATAHLRGERVHALRRRGDAQTEMQRGADRDGAVSLIKLWQVEHLDSAVRSARPAQSDAERGTYVGRVEVPRRRPGALRAVGGRDRVTVSRGRP